MATIKTLFLDERTIYAKYMGGLLKDRACKKLVLISAYYAGDPFMVTLMKNSIPGVTIEAYAPADFVAKWNEGYFGDQEFCACIQKLSEVMQIFDGGCKIDTMDIILQINMDCKEKDAQYKGASHLVGEQVADVKRLIADGVKVIYQKVGGKEPVDLVPFFN